MDANHRFTARGSLGGRNEDGRSGRVAPASAAMRESNQAPIHAGAVMAAGVIAQTPCRHHPVIGRAEHGGPSQRRWTSRTPISCGSRCRVTPAWCRLFFHVIAASECSDSPTGFARAAPGSTRGNHSPPDTPWVLVLNAHGRAGRGWRCWPRRCRRRPGRSRRCCPASRRRRSPGGSVCRRHRSSPAPCAAASGQTE